MEGDEDEDFLKMVKEKRVVDAKRGKSVVGACFFLGRLNESRSCDRIEGKVQSKDCGTGVTEAAI